MSTFLAEIIGTMILIIFGGGVVANVVLGKTKGNSSGWIVITAGWGLGVAMAVYGVGPISGAHINPAVTISLAAIGKFPWSQVPAYVLAQMIGGFLGGIVVYQTYLAHRKETENPVLKLAVFSTIPEIRNTLANVLTEVIGTFVLIWGVLWIGDPRNNVTGGLAPLAVGFLVWAIGLSLGGPTGYAINPARDLGPRIAHFLLPIPGKGDSDWKYAWIPVIAPIIGGLGAALTYRMLW
jgi:glycerol uptake facilitator protein